MKSTSPPSPLPKLVHALVVEDDVFFQSAICEALKTCKTSITPSLASSAKQALRVLEADARSISLVLVDLGLPDDDGVNLLKTIKSQWPTLVCMVVSTSGERERVLAAMSEGACGYLVKGDVNISIAQAVDLVLSGVNPISPELTTYFIDLLRNRGIDSLKKELGLTGRERELLSLFSSGHSYKRCAELMGVSLSTVQSHTRNLYRKLGVRSSLQAVLKAKGERLL